MRERANKRIATEISIIVSVFLSLSHYALTYLQLENTSINGVEYGLEISTIFHLYRPKNPLNSRKNKIKIEETLSKVKFI